MKKKDSQHKEKNFQRENKKKKRERVISVESLEKEGKGLKDAKVEGNQKSLNLLTLLKDRKKGLIMSCILALIGIATLAIGLLLNRHNLASKNRQKDISEEIQKIVITSKSPQNEFVNFKYGFMFTYNGNHYRISQAANNFVFLESKKDVFSPRKTIEIYVGEIPKSYQNSPVKQLEDEFVQSNTSETKDGLIRKTEKIGNGNLNSIDIIKYMVTVSTKNTDLKTKSLAYLFSKENIGYKIILKPVLTEEDETILKTFMEKFSFVDTSKIEKTITYVDEDNGYSFTYDRSKWILSEPYSGWISMVSTWQLGDFFGNYCHIYFRSEDLMGTASEETRLEEFKQAELNNIKNRTEKFEVLKEEIVTVDNQKGYKLEISLKYSYSDEEEPILIYLFTHNNKSLYIDVTGHFQNLDNECVKDLENIVNTLDFAKERESTATEKQNEKVLGARSDQQAPERINLSLQQKNIALNQPAVVRVINTGMVTISTPTLPSLSYTSNKSYKFPVISTGSGFIVSNNGYIVTNGHVVEVLPYRTTMYAISAGLLDHFIKDLLADLLTMKGQPTTPSQVESLIQTNPDEVRNIALGVVIEMLDEKLINFNVDQNVYVNLGDKNVTVSIGPEGGIKVDQPEDVYKAKIVDMEYKDLDPQNRSGPLFSKDEALLKVETDKDLPIVNLGDLSDVSTGEEIFVIGYPGDIDEFLQLVGEKTNMQLKEGVQLTGVPTVTKGIVSAIRNDKNLIQIDASIAHGNSGGPGFGNEGRVIGIATYGVGSESADLNFLIDVNEVKNFLQKNNVENKGGEVDRYWRDGMEALLNGNYSKAYEDLSQVKKLYPSLRELDKYLAIAEQNRSMAGSLGIVSTLFQQGWTSYAIVGGGVIFVLTVIIIVTSVIIRGIKAKKAAAVISRYAQGGYQLPPRTPYYPQRPVYPQQPAPTSGYQSMPSQGLVPEVTQQTLPQYPYKQQTQQQSQPPQAPNLFQQPTQGISSSTPYGSPTTQQYQTTQTPTQPKVGSPDNKTTVIQQQNVWNPVSNQNINPTANSDLNNENLTNESGSNTQNPF